MTTIGGNTLVRINKNVKLTDISSRKTYMWFERVRHVIREQPYKLPDGVKRNSRGRLTSFLSELTLECYPFCCHVMDQSYPWTLLTCVGLTISWWVDCLPAFIDWFLKHLYLHSSIMYNVICPLAGKVFRNRKRKYMIYVGSCNERF